MSTTRLTAAPIYADDVPVEIDLFLPKAAKGLVIGAHVRGEPFEAVTAALRKAGFATLDFSLVPAGLASEVEHRFDASAAGHRLAEIAHQASMRPALESLRVGVLATRAGASAALVAASRPNSPVRAIVALSGRPGFAGSLAEGVIAPTLLVCGGDDWAGLDANAAAVERMQGAGRLEEIQGATEAFEEKGAMKEAGKKAVEWFGKWLRPE